jgi:hypothetical protein
MDAHSLSHTQVIRQVGVAKVAQLIQDQEVLGLWMTETAIQPLRGRNTLHYRLHLSTQKTSECHMVNQIQRPLWVQSIRSAVMAAYRWKEMKA